MTDQCCRRVKFYKGFLVRRIKALKSIAQKEKLKRLTAKALGEAAREAMPGIPFTNVARDIRMLTHPGEEYNPEFDLLWRAQTIPALIERYSPTYLASLVKGVIAPTDLDARRAEVRRRPDGRRVFDPL